MDSATLKKVGQLALEGCGTREIARTLGIPIQEVWRALKEVKPLLKEYRQQPSEQLNRAKDLNQHERELTENRGVRNLRT